MSAPKHPVARFAQMFAGRLALVALLGMTGVDGASAYEKLQTETNLRAAYFLKIPTASTVHVQLIIGAGEVDGQGPEGIAHLVEHLVVSRSFASAKHKPFSHSTNAYTNKVVTNYISSGRVEDLPRLISDAAKVLMPLGNSINLLSRERNIVGREFDLRVSENIVRSTYEHLSKVLYRDHPLARSVLGTPVGVKSISPRLALNFHERFYRAVNASLVVTGNVDRAAVVALTNKGFVHLARSEKPKRGWQQTDFAPRPDTTERSQSDIAKYPVVMAHALFDVSTMDRQSALVVLPLVSHILGSAMPGGLETALQHDAYLVDQFYVGFKLLTANTAEFQFVARPAAGVTSDRIVKRVRDILGRLARDGFAAKTIARVLKRAKIAQIGNRNNLAFQARQAAYWASHGLAPPSMGVAVEQLNGLRKPDFDRLAISVASPRRTVTAIVSPSQ